MIEQIKCQIKNYILGNLITDTELFTVFQIFNIPYDTRNPEVKSLTIEAISACNDINLLQQIYYILFKCNISSQSSYNANASRYNINRSTNNHNVNVRLPPRTPVYNVNLYCLTIESLVKCPIDIKSEVKSDINCRQLFSPSFTRYSETNLIRVPNHNQIMSGSKLIHKISELPCVCWNTVVDSAPFYCSQIILHPLSVMVPKVFPDSNSTGRIMSKMCAYFSLTKSVQNLIRHNTISTNKLLYKWQVVVRFGVYDCTKQFPDVNIAKSELPECLPPYLSLEINNKPIQLGDILPSNSITKEGKRHPRPINITEYLNFDDQIEQTRQYLSLSWWQTPGVYSYYYFGVFVERKISVDEYINKFRRKTNNISRPLSCTIDLIQRKFSNNKQESNDDDDLVISSVLPISLQCPVGRSRITLPLRSIHCDHLQCFDGCLYIQMNERRAAWRCPVCDNSAKIQELFVDEYFQQILERYEKNEDVTEVNIHSDASFQPVINKDKDEETKHKESRERHVSSNNETAKDDATVVVLESDDESDSSPINPENIVVKKDVEFLPPVYNNNNRSENFMIDLTSDNDDDSSLNQDNNTETQIPNSEDDPQNSNRTSNNNSNPTIVGVNSVPPPLESFLTNSVRNVLDRYPSIATTSIPNINFNIHPNSSTMPSISTALRQHTLPSLISDSTANSVNYPQSSVIRNIYPRIQPNQNSLQPQLGQPQNSLLRHHLINPTTQTKLTSLPRPISQHSINMNQIRHNFLQRHQSNFNTNSYLNLSSVSLASTQQSSTINSHNSNSVAGQINRKQILKPLRPSARSTLLPSTSIVSNTVQQNPNSHRLLRPQPPLMTQHKLAKKPIPNLRTVSKHSNGHSNSTGSDSKKRSNNDKHEPRLQVLVIKKSKNNPSEYTLDRRRSNRLCTKNRNISYKEPMESSEDEECSYTSSHSNNDDSEESFSGDESSLDYSHNKRRVRHISSDESDDSSKKSKGNDRDQPERTEINNSNYIEACSNINNAASNPNNLQASYPIVCLSRLDMTTIQSMISKSDNSQSPESSASQEIDNDNNNILTETKNNEGTS